MKRVWLRTLQAARMLWGRRTSRHGGVKVNDREINFCASESVTPKEFLRIERVERGNISRAEIRPPRLGGNDFGRIVVTRRDGTVGRKFGRLKRA